MAKNRIIIRNEQKEDEGIVSTNLITVTNSEAGIGAVRYNGITPSAGNFYGGNSTPTSDSQRLNFEGVLAATSLAIYGTGFFQGKITSNGDVEGVEFFSVAATQSGIVNNGTYNLTVNPNRITILSVRNTGAVNCFALVIVANIDGTITFSTLLSANVTVTAGTNSMNFQNTSGGTVTFAHRRLDLNN
jgi:hypothetical protein